MEAADSNEESFFIKVMYFLGIFSKRNKEHFKNGNDFRELIDFGKNHQEETEPNQSSQRKKSFCLPHMEDNSPKLKETLQSLHRAMGWREWDEGVTIIFPMILQYETYW